MLFVGGHSLGGVLTAFFVGWDSDGAAANTPGRRPNELFGPLIEFMLSSRMAPLPER